MLALYNERFHSNSGKTESLSHLLPSKNKNSLFNNIKLSIDFYKTDLLS